MMVLVHHETIYLDRLTPHVYSIAIVSSSMNDSMNRVFIVIVTCSPLVFVLVGCGLLLLVGFVLLLLRHGMMTLNQGHLECDRSLVVIDSFTWVC
jgi:hypothetical protein